MSEQFSITEVREAFDEEHPYINLQGIEDEVLQEFLEQKYVREWSDGSPRQLESKIELLRDYILANNLTEVQE